MRLDSMREIRYSASEARIFRVIFALRETSGRFMLRKRPICLRVYWQFGVCFFARYSA